MGEKNPGVRRKARDIENASPLSKDQKLLFQLLEAIPAGLFILDANGKPAYANRMAQQLMGKGIVQGGGPDQLAEIYQAYLAGTSDPYPAAKMPVVRALSGETSMITDMEIRHPDRVVPLQVWGAPILDARGKVQYAVAVFSDISDRRRAEGRLVSQYAVARAIAESATLREAAPKILHSICEEVGWDFGAIWVFDAARTHLRCAGVWHRSEGDFAEFEQVTTSAAFERGIGLPGRVWETGGPVWFGDVVRDPNFPRAPVAVRSGLHGGVGFPVVVEGELIAVIEFFSREIRMPGDALLRMMEAHGNQIAQIIQRERAEEEMRKAKEAAEDAARSKAEFLAIMSHEIRTPMNAVMGMTSLLLETTLTLEQQEYAETIRRSNESLLTVINDILDFSKIESARLVLEEHPLELRSTIEQVFDLFARQASDKRIQLVYSIDRDVPAWILGDATRMRQILVNLVNNALKFTEKGEIAVGVSKGDSSGEKENGQIELRFSVRDTGVGIPADRIGRLFKPFSQADTSSTRKYGGTGLGLAICARLVELMGGSIAVQSDVGRGSTFRFSIRTKPAAVSDIPPSTLAERKLDPALADRVPLEILVVEDNPTNQLLMLRVLEKMGYVADTSGNGLEALDALKRRHYDIVFMDIEMPEMNGIETTKAIVATWPAEERPFIIGTTAYSMESDAKECLEAGMDTYLSKPIRLEELQRVLQERGKRGASRGEEKGTPDVAAAPVVEPERVKELIRMDPRQRPDLLVGLIDLYLKQFPEDLRWMKEVADRGDLASLRKAAHRLKGPSLNLGVTHIAGTCKELESRAREGDLEEARALVRELRQSSELVRTSLLEVKEKALKGTT